jgi:hypothetical protein
MWKLYVGSALVIILCTLLCFYFRLWLIGWVVFVIGAVTLILFATHNKKGGGENN